CRYALKTKRAPASSWSRNGASSEPRIAAFARVARPPAAPRPIRNCWSAWKWRGTPESCPRKRRCGPGDSRQTRYSAGAGFVALFGGGGRGLRPDGGAAQRPLHDAQDGDQGGGPEARRRDETPAEQDRKIRRAAGTGESVQDNRAGGMDVEPPEHDRTEDRDHDGA